MTGKLYLIPTVLGDNAPLEVLPISVKKIIENKVNQVYICLDKDAQKQALERAEYFMNNGVEVYFVDLEEKDPAEIGFEKMCKLIKETQPLTFSKFIEYKLFG